MMGGNQDFSFLMDPYKEYAAFTRKYPNMRGLFLLPVGVFFLSLVLFYLAFNGDYPTDFNPLLVIFVICVLFVIGSKIYYDQVIGSIESLPRTLRQERIFWGLYLGWMAIQVIDGALRDELKPIFPVSLVELVGGGVLIYHGRTTGRSYVTWTGIISIVFSFSPILARAGIPDRLVESSGIAFLIFFSVAIIIIGLLDHQRLVRNFRALSSHYLLGTPDATPQIGSTIIEPAHLALLAILSACKSTNFYALQRLTGLSFDDVNSHLAELQELDMILAEGNPRKPAGAKISLTDAGRAAVEVHPEPHPAL
jgi:hypothetical protein